MPRVNPQICLNMPNIFPWNYLPSTRSSKKSTESTKLTKGHRRKRRNWHKKNRRKRRKREKHRQKTDENDEIGETFWRKRRRKSTKSMKKRLSRGPHFVVFVRQFHWFRQTFSSISLKISSLSSVLLILSSPGGGGIFDPLSVIFFRPRCGRGGRVRFWDWCGRGVGQWHEGVEGSAVRQGDQGKKLRREGWGLGVSDPHPMGLAFQSIFAMPELRKVG